MRVKYKILCGLFAVIAAGSFLFFIDKDKNSKEYKKPEQKIPQEDIIPRKESTVHLYFANGDNSFLTAETRQIVHYNSPVQLGRSIIKELIKGPVNDKLMRTIPADTTLRSFFITDDATAFVDLSGSVRENHPGGAKMELLTIYSIVNSLILNSYRIESVKILIQGREANTLAGHIELRLPFNADMLLIR